MACSVPSLPESAVNILDFGAVSDAYEDTAFIQAAIDATPWGGTLYIPAGYYLINPDYGGIWLHSNMTFLMDEEAVLQAMPSSLGYYTVVSLDGVKNVTVSGGTIRGERDDHIGTTGEWGMAIAVWNSENIVISNLCTRDAFGDGIYIADEPIFGLFTRNVQVCYVVSENNRRSGLSVVGANGVVIENSRLSWSHGTAPQSGIIIEPGSGQNVYNVFVRENIITNNSGYGIYADGVDGINDSTIVQQSIISNNGTYGIRLAKTTRSYISRNLIENNGGDSPYQAGISFVDALNSSFERNSIRDNKVINRRGIMIGYGRTTGVRIVGNDICILDSDLTVLDYSLDKNAVESDTTYCERDAHLAPDVSPIEPLGMHINCSVFIAPLLLN